MRIDRDRFPDLYRDWDKLNYDPSIFLTKEYLSGSIKEALKNVHYLTAPIVAAAYFSLKKIHSLLKDVPNTHRTLLVSGDESDWVYCYSLQRVEIDNKPSILFAGFVSDSKSEPVPIPFYIHVDDIGSRYQPFRYLGIIDQEQINMYNPLIGFITCIEVFLNFAEIETKILPPHRQIMDGPTCLYNNRYNHNIKIIDSTYFTTLIKSDAFKVRGHFRLQPYGEGLSKRKLVWINDFEKQGYARKAGKLKEIEAQ